MGRKVAIVVQRYGNDLVGGSETLAREYAERLVVRGFDVTVYTSTALDYVTWRSEYPAGESVVRGVRIRRFAPERERDLAAFNALAEPMYVRATTAEDERAFLETQGPFVPRSRLTPCARTRRDTRLFFLHLPLLPVGRGDQGRGRSRGLHSHRPRRAAPALRHVQGGVQGVRSYAFCSAPEAALVASHFESRSARRTWSASESTRPKRPMSRSSGSFAGSSARTCSTPGGSTRARAATRCSGSTNTPRPGSWAVPTCS